jgi:hypothetical protein
MGTGIAVAQNPTPAVPLPTPEAQVSAPDGYTIHQSYDVGGRIATKKGSLAMYDTLVNLQSGPRVLGGTFELRALPGKKGTLIDQLSLISSGFGGDPNSFTKLNFSKGKIYDFSGLFRRDRQYFDYDLLGNPNIPSGVTIAYGKSGGTASTSSLAWSQDNQSPFLNNSVRRMTDTSVTIFPLSKLTYRAGYSQNIFQGPSLTPSGYELAGSYRIILQEYQRNSTDDFTGAIDWKPIEGTKLTFEEQVNHYKADSYFSLAASDYDVQEADGTKAAILANYDSLSSPYSISNCNTASMGSGYTDANNYTIFSAAQTTGGLPVINAACAVTTSYSRTQPTRILTPTEIFRLQSSSIKNISMNGDARYTDAKMSLPNYSDGWQGLTGTSRSITYAANANAHRAVWAADYGIVWQAMKKFSLSDEFSFSNVQQPGALTVTSKTTQSTPASSTGNATINYPTLTTTTAAAGASSGLGSGGTIGTLNSAYFGQRLLTNNLTGSWDASSQITLSLTYRYSTHMIAGNNAGGNPGDVAISANGTTGGIVKINENGGIFNAALRPASNWDINGSVAAFYADNAFTPMTPRQTKQYRVHTKFRPKSWATISGAYNDVERHNNTNNQQSISGNTSTYAGQLDHVDYSRVVGLDTVLSPNEHYGFDFNYAYSDVYTATNICYLGSADSANGIAAAAPGSSVTICPGSYSSRSKTYDFGPVLDFTHAPTQSGSVALNWTPVKTVKSNIGYNISSVNGSRFYNDARDVAGSLVSTYQSPFLNLAWTIHPGLIWKAEYNFYGYGEGGPSGAQYCTLTASTVSTGSGYTVVPCASSGVQTGQNISSAGETAPRNFHANNVIFKLHYEF